MNKEAIAVAKEKRGPREEVLHNGTRVRIVPVSAQLITEVTRRVPKPDVPVVYNEDKGRDEENPNDPRYLMELDEREAQIGLAAMDAIVMFGVELVDGLPEGDLWVKQLKLMEKMGHLDLSGIDFTDELELEFVYKRYVAVSAEDYELLRGTSGIDQEMLDESEESFRSDT